MLMRLAVPKHAGEPYFYGISTVTTENPSTTNAINIWSMCCAWISARTIDFFILEKKAVLRKSCADEFY